MPTTAYIRLLDYENRIRVRFETKHGIITTFLIQYETQIRDNWHPIVRYDTAHGFAHRDILFPDGTQIKDNFYLGDFGTALTFAQEDLFKNWMQYKEEYIRRTKK